ncbi:MAG: magnesium transporter CorA family protein [Candidatus Azambacteria bacterium]|nr:magnesium transporter CorA family protein [Candidatus Azambacteria bacterium]
MTRRELEINGIKWIYINKPSPKDIEQINEVYPFHPLVMESIVAPTFHPFIEDFKGHLFLILHFPIIYPGHQANKIAEIDFLITEKTLVTITYIDFPRFDQLFRTLQEDGKLQEQFARMHTGFLLYYIIDRLFQAHMKDLDFLEKEVTRIEDKIFEKHGRLTIEDISNVRRDIVDFRRPLKYQLSALASFRDKAERFFGKDFTPYLLDLSVNEERIITLIENQKEMMDVLYETQTSLMADHISQIMRVLTIFSAIVLPLSLVTSIWGMNHAAMPLRDGPFSFWIVIILMTIVGVGLMLFFRKKRWL